MLQCARVSVAEKPMKVAVATKVESQPSKAVERAPSGKCKSGLAGIAGGLRRGFSLLYN